MSDTPGHAKATKDVVPAASASSLPPMPTASAERFASVDVLRGVALMGILVINIEVFALAEAAMLRPPVAGGFTGTAFAVWLVSYLLCNGKMMAIFSMLFGAGLVLMANRFEAKETPFTGIYYRRIFWLFVIGMMHAYLIWYGDILVTYAVCGALVFPLKRLSPRWLIFLGVLILMIAVPIVWSIGWLLGWVGDVASAGDAAEAAGRAPSELQQGMQQAWGGLQGEVNPNPERLAKEVALHRQGYWEGFGHRATHCLGAQIFANATFVFWRSLGLMLLGAGLMKLGVLTAARSYRVYAGMILGGYGIGLPLSALSVWSMMVNDFDFVHTLTTAIPLDYVGGVFVALGHVGLVMTVCKAGVCKPLTAALGAAGRMALTNYLMQSMICVFLFEGWGLRWFMERCRTELVGVFAAVWILQLVLSSLWLARFRFGPVEWLWRSLTYGRLQPVK
ncbi:MAG: DUF418 domain-containing protein [Planctomycetes bacterium]|nr:DUF418 domain-containing protein [Planctomycetota bacterium]